MTEVRSGLPPGDPPLPPDVKVPDGCEVSAVTETHRPVTR
jgi:hypothetical protein